jgi:Tfp pilus assembly protein PilF
MKAGQRDLAIANYQKSLELDAKNQNAVEMLKKLKDTK